MSVSTQSLVSFFVENVQAKTKQVALRHKQLGIWQEWTWLDLSNVVQKYISVLNEFTTELDTIKNPSLLILSSPNIHFFAFAIASQILDIRIQYMEQQDSNLAQSVQNIRPDLIFIEDLKQLDETASLDFNSELNLNSIIFYLKDTRLNLTKINQTYSIIDKIEEYNHLGFKHQSREKFKNSITLNGKHEFVENQTAFIFHKIQKDQHFYASYDSQALIEEAIFFIETHDLNQDEQAYITPSFAGHDYIRYLFSAWLIAGFCLNIPESVETRDQDLRIISPTLLIETFSNYERVKKNVQQKLPHLNSWPFRIIPNLKKWHGEFSAQSPLTTGHFEKLFHAFFKQSILASLGFLNLRTAIVVCESYSDQTSLFYQRLGIKLSPWQSPLDWQDFRLEQTEDLSNPLNILNDYSSSGDSHVIAHHP